MADIFYDSEVILPRFNRLLQDVIKGSFQRTSFEPWEVELLLDIQACVSEIETRRDLLKRYQKAVQRQLGRRGQRPMLLSEYVESLRSRQLARLGQQVDAEQSAQPVAEDEPAVS
ncbi:MAG: hypothetical protein NTZ56_21725 [Acidobacteria bacterium]|nr:hypothetical protein [Acidobacteriota bacterium]